MKHFHIHLFFFLAIGTLLAGCSGTNPTTLPNAPDITAKSLSGSHFTSLLGYYTIFMDIENREIEAVPNRDVMYAVNVTQFLNFNPLTLQFAFNNVDQQPAYIDVDLNVSIGHPIPGKPKFNGYDVRGVMLGNGSGSFAGALTLRYPIMGNDQYLINADGYTRWWNQPEFLVPGLFGYTHGIYGSKVFNGSATINGYKYFADGLAADEDEWSFLLTNPGTFSSGAVNTRNYQIRFPIPTPGIKYDYAILADWSGGPPEFHPSPAPEAIAMTVTVQPDMYYTPSVAGGDLSFDIGLLSNGEGWAPSTAMIDATVLTMPIYWDIAAEIPIDSGPNYAVYHFEIPADNVLTTTGNELIIGFGYDAYDYTNPFGVPNSAVGPLTAYFRFPLPVSDETPGNSPPVIDNGVIGDTEVAPTDVETYIVFASDPDLDPLTYAWTVTDTAGPTVVFSGPGDGAGNFTVDWANDIGATDGQIYDIDCSVYDPTNPPVDALTLTVNIVAGGPVTLYLYDGTVDDGGIVNWDGTALQPWEYCPSMTSWDENHCGPYFVGSQDAVIVTPLITFPGPGEYSELHIEFTHWGDMQTDGFCYASPGTVDDGGYHDPNYITEALIYIEGFDFNDVYGGDWADWSATYGSESAPVWSHFDCSAYEGLTASIAMQFGEYGAGNPDTQAGFNLRKLWVYYLP